MVFSRLPSQKLVVGHKIPYALLGNRPDPLRVYLPRSQIELYHCSSARLEKPQQIRVQVTSNHACSYFTLMSSGSFILDIGIFFAELLLPANLYPHPDTSLALFTLMTAFTTMPLLFYWWHGASSWITILHSVLKPETPAPVKPPSVARAVALDPSIPTVCQLKSLLTMVSFLNMANVA